MSSKVVYDITYGSLLNYYPKNHYSSDLAKQTWDICDKLKNSRTLHVLAAIVKLDLPEAKQVKALFQDASLIPVPRSSPLITGGNWPSKTIAEKLLDKGFGREVLPCLKRVTAVKKSAYQKDSSNRPTVAKHVSTMQLSLPLKAFMPKKMLLIDDVITRGSTTMACVDLIKKALPEMDVSIFSVFRTVGKPQQITMFSPVSEVEELIHPVVGSVKLYSPSGKTWRDP